MQSNRWCNYGFNSQAIAGHAVLDDITPHLFGGVFSLSFLLMHGRSSGYLNRCLKFLINFFKRAEFYNYKRF